VGGRGAVALVLAGVAGFVDAVGFLVLRGLFVAHMSGNSAKLGVRLGSGAVSAGVTLLAAVAVFVTGIALGATVSETLTRRGVRGTAAIVLALEATLLTAFLAWGLATGAGRGVAHGSTAFYGLGTIAVLAMGLQTTALQRAGGGAVRTTYVSGVLLNATQEAVNWLFWVRDGDRDADRSFLRQTLGLGSRRASRDRALLLAGVWLAYAASATLGAFAERHLHLWALAVPLAALLAVIAADTAQPLLR
jgi:uncharacterized membrane protein YoaK (UPF0700 family)